MIRLLDRPGGRLLLRTMAMRNIRQAGGSDISVDYINGLWTHRVGSDFFPDGFVFEYARADFESWKSQMERCSADTREYWLRHYDPREGDVIVDVGAGRGEDTVTFSRVVGKTGRVIAIEAHPLSFSILKSFCQLNRLANVTALHVALMDKAGIARIVESSSGWMENEVVRDETRRGQIRSATLDKVCEEQGIRDIAFVKMNIEGADRYALSGAHAMMPRIRQICVACHDFRADIDHRDHLRTRNFVEQFLTRHGFTLASRQDDPREYVRDHVFGFRAG
jgi:FkbM family methyltransferase